MLRYYCHFHYINIWIDGVKTTVSKILGASSHIKPLKPNWTNSHYNLYCHEQSFNKSKLQLRKPLKNLVIFFFFYFIKFKTLNTHFFLFHDWMGDVHKVCLLYT